MTKQETIKHLKDRKEYLKKALKEVDAMLLALVKDDVQASKSIEPKDSIGE